MLFLAIRQLLSRINQTVLTFIAITLGATAYVVFSGIMGGFQEYLIEKLISGSAHVRISPRDEYITPETFKGIFFPESEIRWLALPSGRIDYSRLTNVPFWLRKIEGDRRVFAYSPQINKEVIFTRGKFSVPGKLTGVNPQKEVLVTTIGKYIIEGSFDSIMKGGSLLAIGEELMQKLGAKMNDTLTIISADGAITPLKIVAVFKTGIKPFDQRTAFSSIPTVQSVTHSSGEITDITIKLHDVNSAGAFAIEYASYTNDLVESWDQANENILFTFRVQNIVRNSTTLTIILVVAFGIYNILNMSVNHKKREIAILRSMGYGRNDIILLFLYQGLILGILGSLLGLLIGYLACTYIEMIPVASDNKRAFIAVNHLIISWNIGIYIKAFILVTLSSMVASFIPARGAGKLSPLDIIRGAT